MLSDVKRGKTDFTFHATRHAYETIVKDDAPESSKWSLLAIAVISANDDEMIMREIGVTKTDIAKAKLDWQEQHRQANISDEQGI